MLPKLEKYPNLTFWLIFFSLNGLLFLPAYIIDSTETTFWPSFSLEIDDGLLRWTLINLFVTRQNADLFRLSIDWAFLVAAWVWIQPLKRPFFRRLLTGLFIFGILYSAYDTLIFAIYNESPNLYDDALLFKSGIEGLTRHIGIPPYAYLLGLLSIIFFFRGCAWLIRQLTNQNRLSRLNIYSHLLLFFIIVYSATMIWRYQDILSFPNIVASSTTAKVWQNVQQATSTYQNRQLLLQVGDQLHSSYRYNDFPLTEKPDVFIIFVESYGDALYQFEDLRQPYLDLLNRLENQLEQNGWHAASIRSEAPIRGGKSWLAYTSFLFGLRVDDEAQYSVLLDTFQNQSYPHLGAYFQAQGYDYQRLTPLLKHESDAAAWEKTRRFFGYDRWLFLNDMTDFAGPLYGWGPSPPDQYSLSFLREYTETHSPNTPHLYFYITHNSHLPWSEPPVVVDDWQSLKTAPSAPLPAYNPEHRTKAAYLQSILYQIEMVTSVILDGPDDALYIIVGDHQPSLRAFADYEGAATPLHIITKKEGMITSLQEQQFTKGLEIGEDVIKHEGFYSLFMHSLLASYAKMTLSELPPILPDGLNLRALADKSP